MNSNTKIIENMSNSDYHAHPALSKSGLDELNKSPLHYWRRYLDPDRKPSKRTEAMIIGSALHSLVLEPTKFEQEFVVSPAFDKRTKDGKVLYENWLAENSGKQIIDIDTFKDLKRMSSAIEQHELASSFLDGFGKPEVSLFFDFAGVSFRCRPDYIRSDGVIVDLKSSTTASPEGFRRKAYDLRYHVQAALYSTAYRACYGEEPKGFVFVVVEKQDPHPVSVFHTTEVDYLAGFSDLLENIRVFKECQNSDKWPGYNRDAAIEGILPKWKSKSIEEEFAKDAA